MFYYTVCDHERQKWPVYERHLWLLTKGRNKFEKVHRITEQYDMPAVI